MYIERDIDKSMWNSTKCPENMVLKIVVYYTDNTMATYYSKELSPRWGKNSIGFIDINGIKHHVIDYNVFKYSFDHITEDEMKKEKKNGAPD